MKVLIRITGMVNMNEDAENTLSRLRLRRKYACTIIDDTQEVKGMVQKVRNFIAYGEIDKPTLIELIKARGKSLNNKKIDAEKVADLILKNKSFENTEIKPFFRLHPPRGGIKSKEHFPKGVLGDNKEKINELIRRML